MIQLVQTFFFEFADVNFVVCLFALLKGCRFAVTVIILGSETAAEFAESFTHLQTQGQDTIYYVIQGSKSHCTTIHRYPIFSARYSIMCKVYTEYHGTSEIEHGFCTCTVDNPPLKLGDYLSVQAHKPCSISHLSTCLPGYHYYL